MSDLIFLKQIHMQARILKVRMFEIKNVKIIKINIILK